MTSSRAETSKKKKKKKKKKAQIGVEIICSILMLLSVHSNLLVLPEAKTFCFQDI